MQIGVLGLPVNEKGEFLLTQRHAPKTPWADKRWQLTGGGMEFGESPEETLVREMKEEIGVIPEIIFPYPIVRSHVWEHSAHYHITLMCYLVDIGEQKITPDMREVIDFRWVLPAEVVKFETLPLVDGMVQEADLIRQKYLVQG